MCSKKKKRIVFQGSHKFEKASEPSDIYWENLKVGKCSRGIRMTFTFLLTMILVGISFAIVSNLSTQIKDNKKKDKTELTTDDQILSIVASLVIVIINKIMNKAVFAFARTERHQTLTGYYHSVTSKLTLLKFINSSLLPFVIN